MWRKLIRMRMQTAVLIGMLVVLGYLALGGPLPGPVGERYRSYLGALFHLVVSANIAATLMLRSALIFGAAFGVSWLLLALAGERNGAQQF